MLFRFITGGIDGKHFSFFCFLAPLPLRLVHFHSVKREKLLENEAE